MIDATGHEPDIQLFMALAATLWPRATIYPPGARFTVPDRDEQGNSIPEFARGRTGTVVTVQGPVLLGGDDIHSRTANVAGIDTVELIDVLDLLGLTVEMVHLVEYDEEPGVHQRLSHMWMQQRATNTPEETRPGRVNNVVEHHT